jgi:polyferredoxin
MSGSINQKSISSIPIKVIGTQPVSARFHWKRRAVQVLAITLAILIPASGLFRIDVEAGAFVLLDRQIWYSDFFLMAGLWIFALSCLVMLYSTAGTVICGWVCPQNTLAEWANHMTGKLLGKRAEVSLTGEAPLVSATKNKALNWILLVSAFFAASMFFALIPLFYFYPPGLVWSFITWQDDVRLAGSLHWIYSICALIIFLDIALIRHFWCRFSCIYRVWQHSFKTKQTLHVTYDTSRADECAKCNYCVTTCFIDLDPRKTEVYDSCINCGECIDACNQLQSKKAMPGLLRFELGERKHKRERKFRTAAVSLFARVGWMTPFALFSAGMIVWGLWTYEPYHVAVGRADNQPDSAVQDYRIAISNKLYRPAELHVRVQGLPEGSYRLSAGDIKLLPAGRESLTLSITQDLPRGLHSFLVEVSAVDGWTGHFNIQHFSGQGDGYGHQR